MNALAFNLCMLLGWLLVLIGGVLLHVGAGLVLGGLMLIGLTLVGVRLGGGLYASRRTRVQHQQGQEDAD